MLHDVSPNKNQISDQSQWYLGLLLTIQPVKLLGKGKINRKIPWFVYWETPWFCGDFFHQNL
jgi:hypothetical protein